MNIALAAQEQDPQIVHAHAFSRLEGGCSVAIFGLEQRQRRECSRRIARHYR